MVFPEADLVLNSFKENDYFGDGCILGAPSNFHYQSNSVSLCLFIDHHELSELMAKRRKDLSRLASAAKSRNKELIGIRKLAKKALTHFVRLVDGMDSQEILYRTQQSVLTMFPQLKPSFRLYIKELEEDGDLRVFTTVADELLEDGFKHQQSNSPLTRGHRGSKDQLSKFVAQALNSDRSQKRISDRDRIKASNPFIKENSLKDHDRSRSKRDDASLPKKIFQTASSKKEKYKFDPTTSFMPALEADPANKSFGPKLSPGKSPKQKNLVEKIIDKEHELANKNMNGDFSPNISENLMQADRDNEKKLQLEEGKEEAMEDDYDEEDDERSGSLESYSDDVHLTY